MRNIKFRFAFRNGKNTVFKYMSLEELLDCDFAQEKMVECINDDIGIDDVEEFIEFELIAKDQYTGLKDKNGVEIFEGDIVNDDLIGICQVKYNDKHAAFKVVHKNKSTAKWFVDYLPNEFKYLEVIGNIHENPELLEG